MSQYLRLALTLTGLLGIGSLLAACQTTAGSKRIWDRGLSEPAHSLGQPAGGQPAGPPAS